MPDASDPADPYASAPTVHEQSLTDHLLSETPTIGPPPTREFPANAPSAPTHQTPAPPSYQTPLGTPPMAAPQGGSRRGWWIAGGAFLVVAALAVTTLLILPQTVESGDGQIVSGVTTPPQTAGPPESGPSVTGESKATVPRRSVVVATATGPAATGPAATVPTTLETPAAAVPADLPLGGPRVDIPCADGYIVQVASELDPAKFEQRVAALRAAGQLPPGAKWTEVNASCAIFTSQVNVLVLYAGPFATAYDACAARLASPPDAFIKGTMPADSTATVTCLCPATPDQLPAITAVGQQGVWVGELQRLLGAVLDYNVGPINADPDAGNPGSWGVYTAETAAAVGRFQGENSLPTTEVVDTATWSALQRLACVG